MFKWRSSYIRDVMQPKHHCNANTVWYIAKDCNIISAKCNTPSGVYSIGLHFSMTTSVQITHQRQYSFFEHSFSALKFVYVVMADKFSLVTYDEARACCSVTGCFSHRSLTWRIDVDISHDFHVCILIWNNQIVFPIGIVFKFLLSNIFSWLLLAMCKIFDQDK